MVTEMITLKLERGFLKDIDNTVKKKHYQSRTEFIRDAVREKLEKLDLQWRLEQLKKLIGSSKKRTTPEEYERMREKSFEKISKKFR